MSDPQARQAVALAAVDRLIKIARAASPGPWDAGDDGLVWPDRLGDPVSGSTELEDATHIAANDPTTVIKQLEGRRRILQRHAPLKLIGDCSRCRMPYARWPCLDWRDAAAGLPLDQDLGEEKP